MPASRRNGAAKPSPPASPSLSNPPQTLSSPSPPIPLWLLVYPSTLLMGSLFSLLDPTARIAPYNVIMQSHPPEVAPSYFAQKKNIFNVYFVKIGWFWITAAYMFFLYTRKYVAISRVRSSGGAEVEQEDPALKRAQGFLRWLAVTLWWIAVTQWFFGAPLIDRGFRWTGGKCEVVLEEGAKDAGDLVTAAACKLAGGSWAGGHDISGHVFLLVLGSAFLGMEVFPVLLSRARAERDTDEKEGEEKRGWAMWFVASVGALSWWMILMTAAYFHTWFEKLTGLLVAFTAIASVYYLPFIVPPLLAVLGAPGP